MRSAFWGNTQLDRDCWLQAAAKTRNFLSDRCDQVIDYLRTDGLIPSIEPPSAITNQTSISFSTDEGTIYYTLDSTDPRAIGGAAVGQSYSGTIPLSQPTRVRARTQKADG